MEVKLILNDDFVQLLDLNIAMYQAIDPRINAFQATNTLIAFINGGKCFTAFGLYDGPELLGFVTGCEENNQTFYFTGIYITVKNSDYLQKLIEFCFDWVKTNGYKYWSADATNENIASILEKYNAKVIFTKYRKEIE